MPRNRARSTVSATRCALALLALLSCSSFALVSSSWFSGDAEAAPSQGPVAAYSFDAGTGETAADVTGNEHDGAIEGPTWTSHGKYGSALAFNGGGEDCVTVPESEELQLTEELTLEAWVKPSGPTEDDPIIFKESLGIGGVPSYAMGIGVTNAGKPEGIIGDEAISESVSAPSAVESNVWTHLAFTYDGAYMRLYVNGTLVATKKEERSPPSAPGHLRIGCSAPWYEEGFDGKIDEVRIYSRALSAGEVQQTMNSTFPVTVTDAPDEVESNDAIMTGTVYVNGGGTDYFFEYGPTTSYGSVANGEEIEGNGEVVEVEEVAINLAPETTYHYRLVAEGPLGTVYGKDQMFMTGERAMTVEEEEEERNAEEEPLTEEGGSSFAPLAKPSPGDFFGMMWDGDIGQMVKANTFDAIENSGAKVFRFVAAPGAEVTQSFSNAASHHLTPLPYLGSGAFPKPGTTAAKHFITYAENAVKAHRSQADTWEIWNEPNMRFQLNPGQKPPVFESSEMQGNVKPAEFAEFYKELVQGIRSVSTGVHILAPGLFGYKGNVNGHLTPRAFLRQFNQALEAAPKLANPYGAVSLHPYVFKTRTHADVKKHRGSHRPENEEDAKQVRNEIKGMIKGVRKLEKHMLGENKPVWVTELGFPVRSEEGGKPSKKIPAVEPDEQALLLDASFSMLLRSQKSLEIEHAIYYNIEDLPGPSWDHHAGLLNENHRPRPAWTAFSKLAEGSECPHSAPC